MHRALALLAVLLSLAILPAHADITLHIDTTTQEIFFSGSDTGLPYTAEGPEYVVDWTSNLPNGGTNAFLPIAIAFTPASGFITNAFVFLQSEGYYGIGIGLSGNSVNTLTADSTQRISYASLDPWAIAIFANLAANPQPLTINPSATGYSDMSVEAVPEPGTITLAALGLGLLAHQLVRRRR